MLELKRWMGARQVYDRFQESGFGLIHYVASVASELCGGAFTPDEFLSEQAGRADTFIGRLFQERHDPVDWGPLRQRLQTLLAGLSSEESREKFALPLYRFQRDESQTATDDFQVVRKVHIRDYAEHLAKRSGYVLRRGGKAPLNRLMVKTFGDWGLCTFFFVDVGGLDRSEPNRAELTFMIGIGLDRGVGSVLNLRELAGPITHYASLIKPHDVRKPPPLRDAEEVSRFAKHAVRAQLCFAELLMTDLAENWRASSAGA